MAPLARLVGKPGLHFARTLNSQYFPKVPTNVRQKPGQARAKRTRTDQAAAPESVAGYWTLIAPHNSLLEVKGSKFYAYAWPCSTVDEAMQHVAATADPKASHNCFAYRIGTEYRSADDGEPSGTAGRPMLSAIDGESLDCVCALVVRYFGGTKLGAGGLVRAYGGAARECLQAAPREFVVAKATLEMTVPVQSLGTIFKLIEKAGAERQAEEYLADGSLKLRIAVPQAVAEPFIVQISNSSAGEVSAQLLS